MNEIFPYKPRKFQKEIMEKIYECLLKRKNLIIEAPAGIGKTVCTLVPCIKYAMENEKGIIYTTRTNSQQRQAIHELKEIGKIIKIKAAGMLGKANMCLLAEQIPSFRNASNEEIFHLCAARKKRSLEALKGREEWNRCIFFENFILNKSVLSNIASIMAGEEVLEFGRHNKICSYEINKSIIREANVVIAPYIYIFDEFLREKFIRWYGYEMQEILLIIDEAHNLPDFCRDMLSFSLSYKSVINAFKEVDEYGAKDKEILSLLNALKNFFEDMYKEIENDALLNEERLNEKFEEFDIRDLEKLANKMITYGDIIADIKESKNMLPRSYIRSIGKFFLSWLSLDERWVKIIEKKEDNIKINAYCLDSSLASSILNAFYCSIHISATLQPLEEYRNIIGIEAEISSYPSPFPKENRKVIYVEGVSTKYYMDDEMLIKIKKYVEEICNKIEKNMLIFFPSYHIMERFIEKMEIERKIYVEDRKDKQKDIMAKINEFKEKKGIFLSVIGGRISEGIDFPSKELEIVIIVGIPYPPPSEKQNALKNFYDKKFGEGWKYAYESYAIRKIKQSIGRLIRREDDKGMAIILDERARRFRKYIEMKKAEKNIIKEIESFFMH